MTKKLNILISGILLIALSCKENLEVFDLENISINFSFSDCKNTKGTAFYESESVEYAYAQGNRLNLLHKNVYFNCCQPENNLQVLSFSGDSIIINEYERVKNLCKCICPYDMNLSVGPLPKKELWLIYKKEGIESFRFTIDFNEGLKGVKSFN